MGIKVSGPQVIAFLEWMRTHYPEVRSLRQLSHDEIEKFGQLFRAGLDPSIEGSSADFGWWDLSYVGTHKPDGIWGLENEKRQQLYDGDLLENYLEVPYKSLVLFTGQDREMKAYLREHWDSWNDESGKLLNFYDYAIRVGSPKAYSYSSAFIESLSSIPGADLDRIRAIGLPCMLLWSASEHAIVPFADVSNEPVRIRERFRTILRMLAANQLDVLAARFRTEIEKAERETADVFISYRHSNRPWVSNFQRALEQEGLETWYDKNIHAGDRFDLRVQRVQDIAKATVVVWSRDAIRSDWVRGEAMYAKALGKLAPVSIDRNITLPPPFTAIHAEDLAEWPKDAVGYQRLLTRLRELIATR